MLSLLGLLLPSAVQLAMKIADLVALRSQAKTDIEKAQIDAAIKELQGQQAVILKAQENPWTAKVYWSLLAIAALGPIAYIDKIFLWDKVIGAFKGCTGRTGPECNLFVTDALVDPNLWWIVIAVFGFLFVASKLGVRR